MKKISLILLFASIVLISGCYSCKVVKAPMPLPGDCQPPCGEPELVPPPPQQVVNCAARIYPGETCGVIKIDKSMPSQVQTGAEFEYQIKVTNLTSSALADIVVTDTFISNFRYISSNPPANVQGNKLIWVFPGLGPKETKEINATAVAAASGIIQNCVDVTYRMPLCVQSVSIQPKLAISKTAPAEVSICEPITYTLKIENTGTGPADNVKIIDKLPDGLVTIRGSSGVEIPIGSIPAGTARSMSFAVKAQKSGTYTNSAVAIADGNIEIQSPQVSTVVRQPKLSITKSGPETQYLDKEITYEIAVTNTGDWPAVNTLIVDEISSGADFVRASRGGLFTKGKVMWKVAKLNPHATAKTSVTYMPKEIGTVANTTRASADCADTVTVDARTQVRGVPAILLEVIDLTDQIRIGNDVTYRIMVTNQGSVVGTNIAVQAVLEPEMEYVSSVGATRGSLSGDTITFAPLPSLAVQARAIWEVTVKAKAQADVRFRVKMKSDQITRDVEETESTNFYE